MKKQIALPLLFAALALSACAARETRPVTVPVTTGETAQTEAAAFLPTEPAARPLVIEDRMIPGIESSEKYVSSTTSTASEEKPSETIPFKIFYRGFTPIPLPAEDPETYAKFSEAGRQIIQGEDQWHDFMDQYCPGIPYGTEVDFAKEYLIASVIGFARPTYSIARELVSLQVENGVLVAEYREDPENWIYALNRDVSNFYVEVLAVKRADLPEDMLK